jgi:hypothetical protein
MWFKMCGGMMKQQVGTGRSLFELHAATSDVVEQRLMTLPVHGALLKQDR